MRKKVQQIELSVKPFIPLNPAILLPHPIHLKRIQENNAIPSLWNGVPYFSQK